MNNSTNLSLYFWLLCGILNLANGLKCYSCLRTYPYEYDALTGEKFQASTKPPYDDTCLWGNTPNEAFLVDCPPSANPDPEFIYGCVSTQVYGKTLDGGDFNVTWRKCAATCNEETTTTEQSNIEISTLALPEYKEGILADVTRDFQDPPGKQVLKDLSMVLDDTVSLVKIIACNTDKCKEPEEEPITESTTTAEESTTQDSGAISHTVAALLPVTSIIILIANIFR